jgi:lysozyme
MSRFDASLLQRALSALGRPVPPTEAEAAADAPDLAEAVQLACALCRRWEGFHAEPYLCPAGVPTIGYGATHYLDGRPVTLRDPAVTREAAERLLLRTIERTYLPAVLRLCGALAGEPPSRVAAIVDFTFNLGAGRLQGSTLRKRINAGDRQAVPAELRKWVIGGGRVLRGLVLRREAEAQMFARGRVIHGHACAA